ncbi:MAG: transcriptional regulator [Phycisphaerae bacterium]|nr:transcriptional regulator [Phycisphaerae bacterium]
MAPATATIDAFTAIAEPRRRDLIGVLAEADGERDVTWIVGELGWPQPQVSKHLGVLRRVGLVSVERRGRQRMYSLNAERLRPVYEWVKAYERFWDDHLQRVKRRAERLEQSRQAAVDRNESACKEREDDR